MQKTIKDYVSFIDQKLAEFNATHLKSSSQQAEIAKYARIRQLRDQKISESAEVTPEGADQLDIFKDLDQ